MTQHPTTETANNEAHRIHQPDSSAQHLDPTPGVPPSTKNDESDNPDGYQPANPKSIPRHGGLRAGAAMSYGWQTLRANPRTWLAVALGGGAVYVAFTLLVRLLRPHTVVSVLVLMAAMAAAALTLYAVFVRGALYQLDGRGSHAAAFVRELNPIGVVATAGLVLVLVALGYLACALPALAVAFLSVFAVHFAMDFEMDPVTAIRSSWRLVAANPGPLLLLAVCNTLVLALGLACVGVGLLAAVPVTALSTTYAFRHLTNGPVAAPLRY
jgi:uncharacterized membrane protein